MSPLATAFAELGKPEIFGRVSPHDPTVLDSPWFWGSSVLVAALVVLAAYFAARLHKARLLAAARRDPVYVLMMRLEHLHARADQPATAFFTELASVLRGAIGLAMGTSATPRTSRELEQLLVGKDCASRARAALAVIKACEDVLFSGAVPADRADILARSAAAVRELLPDADEKLRKGGVGL